VATKAAAITEKSIPTMEFAEEREVELDGD